MSNLGRDLSFTLRRLSRRPAFTATNLLMLSLGLSTVAIALSVAWGVWFSPMPYENPGGIVAVFSRFPESSAVAGTSSYPDFVDFRDQNTTLEQLAATAPSIQFNLTGSDEPVRVQANLVSPSYFDILGVPAWRGRMFLPEEDTQPGGHPVVLVSHRLWTERFGSELDVLGQKILLNDAPYTVVGILPPNFRDLNLGNEVDVWVPMMMASSVLGPPYLENRRGRWLHSIGRLKPGVSFEQARQEMERIARRLEEEYSNTNQGIGVTVMPLDRYLLRFNDLRKAVLVLIIAALLVLLVTILNVSSLVLVDASRRTSEFALRYAIGAQNVDLLRQFTIEGMLLALSGAAVAIVLASWGTSALVSFAPINLPQYMHISTGMLVIFLTLVLGVLTGIAISLLLTARFAKASQRDTLAGTQKLVGRSATTKRAQDLLVVCEVAAAVVLSIAAGLLFVNLKALHDTDLGFDPDGIVTLQLELGEEHAEPKQRWSFARGILDSVEALPSVQAAGLWGPAQPGNSWWYRVLLPEGGDPQRPEDQVRAFRHRITPGALKALKIPLTAGRGFTWQDDLDARPVAIVSQSMAESVWPGRNALGKRFLRVSTPDDPWITVVGIAQDVRHRGRLAENFHPIDVYLPMAQEPTKTLTVFARSEMAPASLVGTFRDTIQSVSSGLPVFNVTSLRQVVSSELNEPRFYAWLVGIFAAIAILLAVTGLYGTLSFSVTQRRKEIGILMALGADRRDIVRLIGGKILLLVAVGLASGLGVMLLTHRVLASLLHGIGAVDPGIYAGALGLLAAASLLAGYLPTRRALQTDPANVLRLQ